ncbi:MAG: HNH endonuclease [Phycisphaerae bacterium]
MTRGYYAKVDAGWYERLAKFNWHAKGGHGECYAARGFRGKNGKTVVEWMHKRILQVPAGYVVDHINRDTMDNRSANLRVATQTQNTWNSRRGMGAGSSKYKGVSWDNKMKKWRVMLCMEGRSMYFGCYDDEKEAARVYDKAARKYHKEFALLNFPGEK